MTTSAQILDLSRHLSKGDVGPYDGGIALHRAAMELARLWQQQGRRDEARALFEPIYDSFDEGRDTPALREVEVLLDELASNSLA